MKRVGRQRGFIRCVVSKAWVPRHDAQCMSFGRTVALFAAWTLVLLVGCAIAPPRGPGPDVAEAAVLAAGEIRGLDHPGFSDAEAADGLWTSQATMQKGGAGIYFLEPYDPRRIPVLFVHGIGGTPRDFRSMLDTLDRTRFQAWVFHYPTGLRLHTASRALRGILAELQRKYRFDALFITAHSMGGLVSRGYLMEAPQDEASRYDQVLITFSSPWEGHPWPQAGARFMPGPPGSWIDLSPASEFLVSLREPLRRRPPLRLLRFPAQPEPADEPVL